MDTRPSTELIENYEEMKPIERGRVAEKLYAERYPYFSWHFPWERYVVVCIPDGITNEFIYEFKTTKHAKYRKEALKQGSVQADIYGYFFRRPRKRVQAYSFDTGTIETLEDAVDEKNALLYLKNFLRVDKGEIPRLPPPFKCRICEYADHCPVRTNHGLRHPSSKLRIPR